MFLSDGTPVRAECALKIRNVMDKKIDDDKSQSFNAPGQGKTYTVKENDRLDLIAARELGDVSRWNEIAAINGVVDATNITDGNGKRVGTLTLPED
jgi:hypothetical protein